MTNCMAVMAVALGMQLTGALVSLPEQQPKTNQGIHISAGNPANTPDVSQEPLPAGHYRVLSEPEGIRLTRPIYR